MHTNRRKFLGSLSVGAAGVTLGSAVGAAAAPAPAPAQSRSRTSTREADGPILQVGDDIAVTGTTSGKVRGYILRGIHHFLGMPYGADTSGPNRFMPPRKPKPWTDVYPALWWGNSAPQNMENRYVNKYPSFRDHWNYDDVSEDCLRINVFTPALKDGRKRPVLFWIHGGGYTNGNAIEQDGYNGENLARAGDVVFCSINHRLGPLGYCNLAGVGGEKYAASGNVGQLDIVAALEWVRDNIENFGGDPGNVTIMGQSGGGAKVCVLTAMPSAKGLFHKAVVLSGASVRAGDKAVAEKLGAYVLAEAGLTAADLDKLQQMPWKTYLEIGRPGIRGNFGTWLTRWLQSVGGRHDPAAASLLAGGGADRGRRADDHLLDRERAGARMDRRVAHERHVAAGCRPPQGTRRLRPRSRRQGGRRGRCLREGVPRQEARRDLVAGEQQPPERRDARRCQGEAAGASLRELVRMAAAAVRRPHRRVPLCGHLFLVPQHGSDVHAHRRGRPAASSGREDVGGARAVHEDRGSERSRSDALAEVHVSQG
jgi:acetyl esterase/lipase